MMEKPHEFTQGFFSVKLTKVYNKNRGEVLASGPLERVIFYKLNIFLNHLNTFMDQVFHSNIYCLVLPDMITLIYILLSHMFWKRKNFCQNFLLQTQQI